MVFLLQARGEVRGAFCCFPMYRCALLPVDASYLVAEPDLRATLVGNRGVDHCGGRIVTFLHVVFVCFISLWSLIGASFGSLCTRKYTIRTNMLFDLFGVSKRFVNVLVPRRV